MRYAPCLPCNQGHIMYHRALSAYFPCRRFVRTCIEEHKSDTKAFQFRVECNRKVEPRTQANGTALWQLLNITKWKMIIPGNLLKCPASHIAYMEAANISARSTLRYWNRIRIRPTKLAYTGRKHDALDGTSGSNNRSDVQVHIALCWCVCSSAPSSAMRALVCLSVCLAANFA